jgi:hypothetical protein
LLLVITILKIIFIAILFAVVVVLVLARAGCVVSIRSANTAVAEVLASKSII